MNPFDQGYLQQLAAQQAQAALWYPTYTTTGSWTAGSSITYTIMGGQPTTPPSKPESDDPRVWLRRRVAEITALAPCGR